MYSQYFEDSIACLNDEDSIFLEPLFNEKGQINFDLRNSNNESPFHEVLPSSSFSNTNDLENPSEILGSKIRKKRGRKSKKEHDANYKVHSKYKIDNLKRTIQVHFFNFLIQFLNVIMNNLYLNYSFKGLDYDYKRNVKNKNIENLKSKSIKEILSEAFIAKAYNELDKDYNKNLIKVIEKNDQYLFNILNLKFKYIFESIYYKNIEKINLNDFNITCKEIILSKNVNTFKDIYESENIDLKYKKSLHKTAQKYFCQ